MILSENMTLWSDSRNKSWSKVHEITLHNIQVTQTIIITAFFGYTAFFHIIPKTARFSEKKK